MMFEDPEGHDEEIIAEDEEEIPYTDEDEIDEIVNDIVSELRAFGYFPTVRTISMGGYTGAIEVSGWDRDNSSKIEYRIDIGTNVLHIRRTVTVPFPSEEKEIERLLRGRSSINIMDTFSQRRPIRDVTGRGLMFAQEVQRIHRSVMNLIVYILRNR